VVLIAKEKSSLKPSYRATVSNHALPAGRATGLATFTTLLDSDGDGIPYARAGAELQALDRTQKFL